MSQVSLSLRVLCILCKMFTSCTVLIRGRSTKFDSSLILKMFSGSKLYLLCTLVWFSQNSLLRLKEYDSKYVHIYSEHYILPNHFGMTDRTSLLGLPPRVNEYTSEVNRWLPVLVQVSRLL